MGSTKFHVNKKKGTNQGIRGQGKETIFSRKSKTGLRGCVKQPFKISEPSNTGLFIGRGSTKGGVGSLCHGFIMGSHRYMASLLKKKKAKTLKKFGRPCNSSCILKNSISERLWDLLNEAREVEGTNW